MFWPDTAELPWSRMIARKIVLTRSLFAVLVEPEQLFLMTSNGDSCLDSLRTVPRVVLLKTAAETKDDCQYAFVT